MLLYVHIQLCAEGCGRRLSARLPDPALQRPTCDLLVMEGLACLVQNREGRLLDRHPLSFAGALGDECSSPFSRDDRSFATRGPGAIMGDRPQSRLLPRLQV